VLGPPTGVAEIDCRMLVATLLVRNSLPKMAVSA